MRVGLAGSLASPGAPSFIADIFFVTQKMLHVGLLPALNR